MLRLKRKIISLIDELVTKENKALIFVTHDLAVVAELCDRFDHVWG